MSPASGASLHFVPPPNLFFRIVGYTSKCAIFSRKSSEPYVGHRPVSDRDSSDQWFSVLHISPERGLVALKGRESGLVLYSRNHQDPRVGHIDRDGIFADNWFQIESGDGDYSGYFRLVTPSQGVAIFSRTNVEPVFLNQPSAEPSPDQYFSFIWEDMDVEKVEYELDDLQITSFTSVMLAEQVLINDTSVEQTMSFNVKKSVRNSSAFRYGSGFFATRGTTFTVTTVPVYFEGKFNVVASDAKPFTWGETTEYDVDYNAASFVKAGPQQTVRATAEVDYSTLDVPFTIFWTSKKGGVRVETKGTYHAVSTWGLRYRASSV